MIEITDAAVLEAVGLKLPAGSGLSFTKESDGVFTLLPAVDYDRLVAWYSICTEEYFSDTGAMPDIILGQGDDDDKFAGTGDFQQSLNAVKAPADGEDVGPFARVGILSSGQPMIVTCTAATGDGLGASIIAAVAIAAITPA